MAECVSRSAIFLRADVGAGSPATINQTLFLKILQRPADGGTGDAEAFDELRFAGQATRLAILSRDDFGGELAGDGAMLGGTVHGKSCQLHVCHLDMTSLFKDVNSFVAILRHWFKFASNTCIQLAKSTPPCCRRAKV
jgi:hypothetical protein